jgi:D-alanyl-D-alanine carboxypeptidase (penicillin-binding protein 5/6)
MKRMISIALCLALMLSVFAVPVYAVTDEPTRMEAEAYMLLDMRSGKVLLQQNADVELEPASTTKMVTGIIIIEEMEKHPELKERTLVADAEVIKTGGTSLTFKEGEEINAWDCLNALLIASCNDCAVLFAKTISGSVPAFVERMNQKLLEIEAVIDGETVGVTHTQFMNPHGLHDEGHYTTARDLAVIAMYCMQNETFREIVGKSEYTIPKSNKWDARNIVSTNKLIADDTTQMYVYNDKITTKYDGVFGVKTGFTTPAGGCLVAACEQQREGDNASTILMSVVMKSGQLSRFADTHKLLNWGFENYYTYKPVEDGTDEGALAVKRGAVKEVGLKSSGEFYTLLPRDASTSVISLEKHTEELVQAPVAEGTKLGYIDILEGGNKIGSVDIIASGSVEKGGPLSVFGIDDATAHKVFVGIIAGFATLVIAFIAWVFWARHQTKVKKARKAARIKALKEEEARRRAMWERSYDEQRRNREE